MTPRAERVPDATRDAAPPPGAAGPGTPASRGVPGPQGPAASGAPGAAGRTWTVELPPLELLNANHRLHWAKAAKATRAVREAAAWTARAAKVPRLGHARIVAELRFADGRKRDPGNWSSPAAKAATDGLIDAGVLEDDDSNNLIGPDMRLGDPDRTLPYGTSVTGKRVRLARLVLHIIELPEVTRGD